MKKYYIGILILLALTLGLTGYTFVQAAGGKQDKETEKKAKSIASKLNNYITRNQKIPEKLSDAGIKDVPTTVTYSKLSSKEYKFCVTYKSAKGYSSSGPGNFLFDPFSQRYVDMAQEETSNSDYKSSYLYLSYTHKKGQNCQTITPYIRSSIYNNYYDYGTPTDFENL